MRRKRLDIMLPWPPKELSPNHKQRVFRLKLREIIKWYRACARVIAYEEAQKAKVRAIEGTVNVEFHFYPPDNAHRDEDNLLAGMKAGIDGIADALCVNDYRFHYKEMHVHAAYPGGQVLARLSFLQKTKPRAARSKNGTKGS